MPEQEERKLQLAVAGQKYRWERQKVAVGLVVVAVGVQVVVDDEDDLKCEEFYEDQLLHGSEWKDTLYSLAEVDQVVVYSVYSLHSSCQNLRVEDNLDF